MPVTAKLSRKFYETFGDEIANELVEWFNAVDATYRSELREINELNFARFDAKLEQRLALVDARMSQLEDRMDQLEARLDARMAQFEARFERRLGEFQQSMPRWMVGLWVPTAIAVISLLLKG